jgi:hypothetical protein
MNDALFPFMQSFVAWIFAATGAVGMTTCIFASGRIGSVGSEWAAVSLADSVADMARM